MGVKEFENQLENVLDSYASNAHNHLDNINHLSKGERTDFLQQALDELYKQNYYALQGLKHELMIYLKQNK